MAVKWHDLTWSCKSPKFNLHHLRKIPTGFKIAVQTPKSGIDYKQTLYVDVNLTIYGRSRSQMFQKKGALKNFPKIHRTTTIMESLFE